jgi:hypothetical protein
MSVYDFLARFLGTTPIRVRLTPDAFIFQCGQTESHVRPLAWCSGAGVSAKILTVGDEVPLAGGLPVPLSSPEALALPLRVRQRAPGR